jgi:hypothetical protein
MPHTPDIDVIPAIDVEDEIRVARQRPGAQIRLVQLTRAAQRTGRPMAAEVSVSPFDHIDIAERGGMGIFG